MNSLRVLMMEPVLIDGIQIAINFFFFIFFASLNKYYQEFLNFKIVFVKVLEAKNKLF